jgi:hypothetical protein
MKPGDASVALVRRLLAEVRADRGTIVRRSGEVKRWSDPEASTPERCAALALALDRTYTAFESILERIARSLEGGPPAADDWHQSLLANASLDIERVRPRILGESAAAAASELRRFRHFLRHAYAADLDADRLRVLARGWTEALPSVETDLDRFESYLTALARTLEDESSS